MNDVIRTAYREVIKLCPLVSIIEIAGSIRRGKVDPGDADICLIPNDPQAKRQILQYAKQHQTGNIGRGENHASYKIGSVEVELYFAEPRIWGAMLMYSSGPQKYNMLMRKIAKLRNMKLNQYGLYRRDSGKMVAGETEEGIYAALGRNWKPPERRGYIERR